MTKLLEQTGAVIAALVASFAITAVGQGVWGALVALNVKLTPALPWAAGVMPPLLAAIFLFLAGRGWPRWRAASRRALVPLGPVPLQAWTWSLAAGLIGVVALAGLWTVLGSLVQVAPNALPDARGVPALSAITLLIVGAAAAPLAEEIAFRGYAMGLLRRRFGAVTALVVSSLMFAAAHFTQGLYPTKLAIYFLFGLSMAATAWRTGSLLPGMVVHAIGYFLFYMLVWSHDAGRRLVTEGGADAGLLATVAVTGLCVVLWCAAFRRLLQVTGSPAPAATLQADLTTREASRA